MPGAAEQVLAEALGDDRAPSEGDAMEVCSEHVEPSPEPAGERRAYSHRSVPGHLSEAGSESVLLLENSGFDPGPAQFSLRETAAGLERWLQREVKANHPTALGRPGALAAQDCKAPPPSAVA